MNQVHDKFENRTTETLRHRDMDNNRNLWDLSSSVKPVFYLWMKSVFDQEQKVSQKNNKKIFVSALCTFVLFVAKEFRGFK